MEPSLAKSAHLHVVPRECEYDGLDQPNKDQLVEQIERFYAKHLPLSREMAKNLQSFGEE